MQASTLHRACNARAAARLLPAGPLGTCLLAPGPAPYVPSRLEPYQPELHWYLAMHCWPICMCGTSPQKQISQMCTCKTHGCIVGHCSMIAVLADMFCMSGANALPAQQRLAASRCSSGQQPCPGTCQTCLMQPACGSGDACPKKDHSMHSMASSAAACTAWAHPQPAALWRGRR